MDSLDDLAFFLTKMYRELKIKELQGTGSKGQHGNMACDTIGDLLLLEATETLRPENQTSQNDLWFDTKAAHHNGYLKIRSNVKKAKP